MASRGRPPKAETTEQEPINTEPEGKVEGAGLADQPVNTTAPEGVTLLQCEVVKEVVNSEDLRKMIVSVEQCRNMYNDMNSRVQEIENFRNTSSIEGKIQDITEKYDEILHIVGELKAKFANMEKYVQVPEPK